MDVIPQNPAGILKLPPKSLPIPEGEHLLAMSPASPPELPPVALVLSQGLRALPKIKFTDSSVIAIYGILLLTKGIPPALFISLTANPSLFCNFPILAAHPIVLANPFISKVSLIEIGIPNNSPLQLSGFSDLSLSHS
jgi:hypothetical protein